MAGAFHGIGEPDCVLNVGVSGPGVVATAIEAEPNADFGELASVIKRTAFKVTQMGELVGRAASAKLGVPFGIVDVSLAPTPAPGDSVGRILPTRHPNFLSASPLRASRRDRSVVRCSGGKHRIFRAAIEKRAWGAARGGRRFRLPIRPPCKVSAMGARWTWAKWVLILPKISTEPPGRPAAEGAQHVPTPSAP